MRTAAAAIGWELARRHRWGFTALAVYFLGVIAVRLLVLEPGERINFDSARSFALAIVVPLAGSFIYFLGVFSFGLSGDLAARQSVYPPRMFTLPVSTAALAGWPMLYGMVAIAILWLVYRFAGVWSEGDIPILWPALLAAVMLGWTQVLTWMPYGLRGVRVAVTVLWLSAIDVVAMVALEVRASEGLMLALIAPHVPVVIFAARHAVGRARRGDTPDWGSALGAGNARADRANAARFRSAERAQEWLEWRQYGASLPWMVALVLPFELALLFIFNETPLIVFEILFAVAVTPPFMAAFVAASAGKPSAGADSNGLPPFIATRPLSNAALVKAKLKVSLRSSLLAWALVLTAVPAALTLSEAAPVVRSWWSWLIQIGGPMRAAVFVLLMVFVFVAETWKHLVQNLYVGMSGREWAVKTSVFGNLALLTVAAPFFDVIVRNPRTLARFLYAVPDIATVLVTLKLTAGFWVAVRLRANGLVSDRHLILGVATWSAAVFGVVALLDWLTPDVIVRTYILTLLAILAVPLTRLSAAPLAVAWNRHG